MLPPILRPAGPADQAGSSPTGGGGHDAAMPANPVDEVCLDIAASPEHLYDLVADVANMGRWSPETYRTEWLDGHTKAEPGARFRGWNRTKMGPIPVKWFTTCVVERADRGHVFSFRVRDSGAIWTYRFEPVEGGTRVTETREVGDKPIPARLFGVILGGARDETIRAGMQATLERLKDGAEVTAA